MEEGHNAHEAHRRFGQGDPNHEQAFQGAGAQRARPTAAEQEERQQEYKQGAVGLEARLLTPSERSDEVCLKNMPEIEDNLSNKVINLNQSSRQASQQSSGVLEQAYGRREQRPQEDNNSMRARTERQQTQADKTATPPINMHMNMLPVAHEVEKLRLFISNLTEQMINIMKAQERQIESQLSNQSAAVNRQHHEQ